MSNDKSWNMFIERTKKNSEFYCAITDDIFFSKDRYNYIVTTKKGLHSVYYQKFEDAVKYMLEYKLISNLDRKRSLNGIIQTLEGINSKIEKEARKITDTLKMLKDI